MKPVHLSIAGLQSYRDKQDIDFTKLCGAGVFGIFGPTGSGKSSILDAMTLALFGKVERAANGTQGILNQSEAAMAVSFTFELSQADRVKRYKVERQFKRSGDVSVHNSVCRIIDLSGAEPIVLADKAADVNQRIQQLLGLSMADFTRAVVLPQGKFAEFLALKGTDRRQMLQRIFHLERYGDVLNGRLSAVYKETDVALKEIAAEQLGLGDASAEALEAAGLRASEAERSARDMRNRLEVAQRQWEERKQIRDWQKSAGDLQRERDELAGRRPDVERLEERLFRARQAERLRPYLEGRDEAAQSLETERLRLREAGAEHERLKAGHDAAQAFHAEAQERLSAEEGPLLVRLEQLQMALRLEDEITTGQGQLTVGLDRRKAAEDQLRGVEEELVKLRDTYKRAVGKQAELKDGLKAYEVKTEDRERANAAVRDKQKLDGALEQHKQLSAELEAADVQLADGRARLAELRNGLAESAAERAELLAEGQAAAADLGELEAQADAFGRALANAAERLKRAQRDTELHRLAARLAEGLCAGEACPVCGAAEHPRPAIRIAGAGDSAEAWLAALERLHPRSAELALGAKRHGYALDAALQPLRAAASGAAAGRAGGGAGEVAGGDAGVAHAGDAGEVHDGDADAVHDGDTDAVHGDGDGAALGGGAGDARHAPERGAQSERLAAAFAAVREAAAALAPAEAPSRSEAADAPGTEAAAGIDSAADAARALEAALAGVGARAEGLAARLRGALAAQAQLAQREAIAAAQLAAADAAAETLRRKRADAERLAGVLREAWAQAHAGLAPEQAERERERLAQMDRQAEATRQRLDVSVPFIEKTQAAVEELQRRLADVDKALAQTAAQLESDSRVLGEKRDRLAAMVGSASPAQLAAEANDRLHGIRSAAQAARERFEQAAASLQQAGRIFAAAEQTAAMAAARRERTEANWLEALTGAPFATVADVRDAVAADDTMLTWEQAINRHREREAQLTAQLAEYAERLAGREVTDLQWEETAAALTDARERDEQAIRDKAKAERDLEDVQTKHRHWLELESKRSGHEQQLARLVKLQAVLRGNAFVEFVAEEQLVQVSRAASERLGQLTRQRYALEVDSGGGFIIRDDANGGIRRPVSTLSGGETFLTSLALALALSAQIQLSGQYPLEFFFLDEGFGTLDPDLLETVVGALEKLHVDRLTVGVISHVPELRERLPHRLVVEPAEPGGRGSRVRVEGM